MFRRTTEERAGVNWWHGRLSRLDPELNLEPTVFRRGGGWNPRYQDIPIRERCPSQDVDAPRRIHSTRFRNQPFCWLSSRAFVKNDIWPRSNLRWASKPRIVIHRDDRWCSSSPMQRSLTNWTIEQPSFSLHDETNVDRVQKYIFILRPRLSHLNLTWS